MPVYGLHLFALSGFAVAQPIFYLLSRRSVFLVAHQAAPADTLFVILVLLFLPPLALWLFELLSEFLVPRLGARLHLMFLSLLIALMALPGLKRIPKLPGAAVILLALLLGVFFSFIYFRFTRVRSFMTLLAVAPIILAISFASSKPIFKLLAQRHIVVSGSKPISHPVIMVIFDELSVFSLMDERKRVDAARYPSFAALARDSTWYRNTTTVHHRTSLAIPAILTGRYPQDKSRPNSIDYPYNLFSWLRGGYQMNIHESVTAFNIQAKGAAAAQASGFGDRFRNLSSDILIIYLHIVLPGDLASGLPLLEGKWRDFGGPGGGDRGKRSRDRVRRFHAFLESITPCERGCLHFLHITLPHYPWQYLPSGKRYGPERIFGIYKERWSGEEWWANQGYQRHLLQVAFADKLLGELIARLKSLDLYDRSLVIVTADHGSNFWPLESHRNLKHTKHLEAILRVPLFMKAPYRWRWVVSDRDFETVDILPTIADQLGIRIDWPVDGCSALAPGCPERKQRTVILRGKRVALDADLVLRDDSLKRKIALFGSGTTPNGLFSIGGYPGLLGRKITEIGEKGIAQSITSFSMMSSGSTTADEVLPARVVAFLEFREQPAERAHIAVAVNGTIRAVAPVLQDGDSRWVLSAMIPEEAFQGGQHDLQFFWVKGTPEKPELFRIPALS